MSRIPREFINELLVRCDIVELIDARVPLRKKGNNYSACCPFHTEKTPSFTVSPAKQFYHCFGCGVNGNAISFLMDHDRLSFVEAVEQLATNLGLTIPQESGAATSHRQQHPDLYQLMDQVAVYYQQQLRATPQAITYLKQRGVTGQIAKEFRIGYAPSNWDSVLKKFGSSAELITQLITAGLIIKKTENNHYDRFRDRIMFPIRDRRGRVIAFGGRVIGNDEPKYLNSPETPIFHKGSELYGLFEACQATRNLTRLLVVEGYMDVIALAQHDIRNVIATLGTATTADHIQRLSRITQEIIFCFDGDRAGQAAAWRALETTLPLVQDGIQVRFLFLPEEEDPDSLVRKEGAEQFDKRIDKASSLADFLFATLSKKIDLSTAEGKARFAKNIVPLLNKLPSGVFQHMLFERLANTVRMDVNTLKNLTRSKTKSSTTTSDKKPELKRSPMRLAIALLLQNPNLAQNLPTLSETFILPGSQLLIELINLIRQTPNLNTAALIEGWRDRPEYSLLTQLATLEIGIPTQGVEQELLGTLGRLEQANRERLVEQLLAKVDQLTDTEKMMLQKLIAIDRAGANE
jgi:DNA primase